jgi:hypothetical protein
MANLRGMVTGISAGHIPAAWIQSATILGSISVLIWVAARVSRNRRSDEQFLIAIVASVVVSYYLFIHDLAVLLIPIVLTLNRFISCHVGDVASRLGKLCAALMLVAPMLVFLIPGHFYLVSLVVCGFLLTLVQAYKLDSAAVNAPAELPVRS